MMHLMGTGRRWGERGQAASLVEECEAFLAGRLAERAFRTTGFVPDWTWMNLLAHGTYAELLAERDIPPSARRGELLECWQWLDPSERWRRARSYLAAEVLDLVDSEEQLEELRHQTLLPIEEDLARRGPADVDDPRDWVNLTLAALKGHRRSGQRFRHVRQPRSHEV